MSIENIVGGAFIRARTAPSIARSPSREDEEALRDNIAIALDAVKRDNATNRAWVSGEAIHAHAIEAICAAPSAREDVEALRPVPAEVARLACEALLEGLLQGAKPEDAPIDAIVDYAVGEGKRRVVQRRLDAARSARPATETDR